MMSRKKMNKKLLKMEKKLDKSAMKSHADAISRNDREARRQHKYLLAKEKAERTRKLRARGMDYALEIEAINREIRSIKMMCTTNSIQRKYRKNAKREIEELKAKRYTLIKKYKRQLCQKKMKKRTSHIIPTIVLVVLLALAFVLLK